jgi:hypothetical protein
MARQQPHRYKKEAASLIGQNDADIGAWVKTIMGMDDPWTKSSYDIVIPTDKSYTEESVELIFQFAESDVVQATDE